MNVYSTIVLNGLIVIISFYVYKSYSALNIIDLTELNKCPFCYGKTACTNLFNGNIKMNSSTSNIFYNLINLVLNSKNVYYGSYKHQSSYKDIVVKKLANDNELKNFDTYIRTRFGVYSNFQKMEKNFKTEISKFLTTSTNDVDVKLKLCPDPHAFDILLPDGHDLSSEEYIHFYTMLYVNPEPILMQILNASHGWPVPHFYGSCGRLVIVENCGTRISSLMDSDWCHRAKLARDILHLAHNLTYLHDRLSVYLTDVSLDNLVVSEEGVVKIVDLEHTIVVDRHPSSTDLPQSWFLPHHSYHQSCDNCFAYSADEVCAHRISDHNFYAVCKEVLSNTTTLGHQWLLHSPPPSLHGETSLLSSLIESCVDPPPGVLRKNVAAQIIQTIDQALLEKC
ncbi:deleted in autism protein 1 [Diaphorina citri]|uniref:Deleted in autism protein 1 n=1 Tax=Diaphorina citri TaxID=121845 RepID=A0A1S3DB12_DIACI|nr:deleted in autism protein 1 [Diaphorina citri]